MRPKPILLGPALAFGLAAAGTETQAQTLAALCQKDGKVRFFDGRLGKVLAEEDAGPAPRVLGTAPGQLKLYVANDPTPRNPNATLRAIGTVTGRAEGESGLPGCRGVSDLEPGPDEALFVACEDSEDLLEVSASDGGLRRRHAVGRGASGVVFHSGTGQLVIANRRAGEIVLYRLEQREVAQRLRAGKAPRAVRLGFDETLVGILDEAAPALVFFEPEAESFGRPVPIGQGPRDLSFIGASPLVLVTGTGRPSLQAVDLEEEAVRKGLDLGPGAQGIAVDSAGHWAWVSNSELSTITVLDLESWALVHTLPLPGGPTELVLIRE
jgi:DNA-binding beta-propeller fold protein YncE